MGTNFYFRPEPNSKNLAIESLLTSDVLNNAEKEAIQDLQEQAQRRRSFDDESWQKRHIGKRNAAGLYCWDCNRTLCRGGNAAIHRDSSESDWEGRCSACGAVPGTDTHLAVDVELGFCRPREVRPSGVGSAASFSWGIQPQEVRLRCAREADAKIIEDEYGRHFTGQEFLDMLSSNCPLEFTEFIGLYFS